MKRDGMSFRHRRHWCGITAILLAMLIGALSIERASAQPGEPKAKGDPPGRGPPRSPEEFFERERAKVAEKAAKEGSRFDVSREMQKLNERFQKDFGEPLPDVWQHELGNAARAAVAPPDPPAARTASSTQNAPAQGSGIVRRGPRYADGLPAWYRARDVNSDGQVSLSEWPRAELKEFREWDLNQDGFIAQTEMLRRLRTLGPVSPLDRSKMMNAGNRLAASNSARLATSGGVTPPPALAIPHTNPVNAKASPNAPPSPDEFVAREIQKLLEKAAREGDRFDPDRELLKLREKYRKDLGEEMPFDVESAFHAIIR